MASATSKLDILINAKNNASGVLRQIGAEAQGLDQAFGNLGKALAGGAIAAGIVQIGQAAVDLARGGAEVERLGASFETLATQAGDSSDEMLSAMDEAARGTIANRDLMLAANRAMLLGVADSADEMAQLLEVAGARAKAMGLTTAEAFSDIVTGIGRLSPMILDNLGIVVDAAAANEAYAASVGKSVEELSEQEQKQALVNQVIANSTALLDAQAGAGDDAASNFERMDASIQNAKDALGELFSPAMAIIAQDIANAAEAAVNSMENLAKDRPGDWLGLIELTEQAKMADASAKMVAEDFGVVSMTAEQARAAVQATAAAAAAAGRSFSGAGPYVDYFTQKLAALKAQSDATTAALNAIRSSAMSALDSAARAAVGVMGASAVARIYGPQKERLDAQIKALNTYGRDADWAKFKIEELATAASRPFDLAVEAAREAEKQNTAVGASVASLSQEYENLQSKVSSVLSGALDVGVGVDPQKILESMGFPREDAINENARRLADIAAHGLKDQSWLAEFQREVPDIWRMLRVAQNPQEEAARLLKDFQDGLLTSPIDKEMAKEIVRRQILGEQNMASLAHEIAGELASEMGVPLQQALAATQSTMGGGGLGTEAARQFSDSAALGLEESGGGGAFVDTFVEQMRARYSLLQVAGQDAGKAWGSAFLAVVGENVPPALIDILVTLTTPGVMAKFAQQGTMQGAVP